MIKKRKKCFWNIIKATASLMTTSQVLRIRLGYPGDATNQLAIIWGKGDVWGKSVEGKRLLDAPAVEVN